MTSFNKNMRRARIKAKLTQDDVVFAMRRDFGELLTTTTATLSRYETNTPEDKTDEWLIVMLAQIYGVPTAQLSPRADAWRQNALRVLTDCRCSLPAAA
jgi:transcriptional regulator with XRE-family HTH domain